MRVYRCIRCGKEVDIIEREDLSQYIDLYASENCDTCKQAPRTAEDKLLDALFDKGK